MWGQNTGIQFAVEEVCQLNVADICVGFSITLETHTTLMVSLEEEVLSLSNIEYFLVCKIEIIYPASSEA